MAFEKILGDACPCHSERSEESAALAREWPGTQILRFAQNDMSAVSFGVGFNGRVWQAGECAPERYTSTRSSEAC